MAATLLVAIDILVDPVQQAHNATKPVLRSFSSVPLSGLFPSLRAPPIAILDLSRSAIATDHRNFNRKNSCRKSCFLFPIAIRSRSWIDKKWYTWLCQSVLTNPPQQKTSDSAIRALAITIATSIARSGEFPASRSTYHLEQKCYRINSKTSSVL